MVPRLGTAGPDAEPLELIASDTWSFVYEARQRPLARDAIERDMAAAGSVGKPCSTSSIRRRFGRPVIT
jgi:hypothetical protein